MGAARSALGLASGALAIVSGLHKEKHTMKQTGILLTLLASMTLVLVVACGGGQEAPPALQESALPPPPPPPGAVVSEQLAVPQPPPPLAQEARTPPPASGSPGVPGYWGWENGWQCKAGHWEHPPQRMTAGAPGGWVQEGQPWV